MDDTLPLDLLPIGELVGNTYLIRRRIGEGAMGQVFEALDRNLARPVALKCGRPLHGISLRREAQAMAAVRHPNLVTVHAYGRHRGLEYIVMELVHGISLREHLHRHALARTRFPVEDAVRILRALAETLDVVHRAGILHRDVKPSNVLVAPANRIALVDFGVFVPECELADAPQLAGTPQYMAPELIREQVRPGGGHLVDLYALGVLAFEMLAGYLPFDGDIAQVFARHLSDSPPELGRLRGDVPPELSALVRDLLAKEPDTRPQAAEEVVWRLDKIAPPRTVSAAARVLVVDDDADSRDAVAALVSDLLPGAHVVTAASAERAVELAKTIPPDVVIVDLALPGANGVELCMYLRGTQLGERCAMIVLSGRVSTADRRLLEQLGVRHVVEKGPTAAGALRTALQGLAMRRRAA